METAVEVHASEPSDSDSEASDSANDTSSNSLIEVTDHLEIDRYVKN